MAVRARTLLVLLFGACLIACDGAAAGQDGLAATVEPHEPILRFDWPAIQVGVGSYEAGPTGVTVIRFPHRASLVVDTRGGAPGTVNTDALHLGYDQPRWDAVVFAGGSAYGEEAITAVTTGLKDDGLRSGKKGTIAFVTGAIIYDFGSRRLNEIYPDKRLAQAALHALHPGSFPLGAQGAGRMAIQGSFFGCNAHSGQGAAFREIDGIKVAAFVVVNALGSVVDRQGKVLSCHPAPNWHGQPGIAALMSNVSASRSANRETPQEPGPSVDTPTHRNTTISLIVTNKKLTYAQLSRLAVQVHTSMARAIQPFSTFDDGDTLFAASTNEVPGESMMGNTLDTIAGEVMWDAILASVPQEPPFNPPPPVSVSPERLRGLSGTYAFGPEAKLKVMEDAGQLKVLALESPVFEFRPGTPAVVQAISDTAFYVAGRYHTRLSFVPGSDGRVSAAILNAGPWAQTSLSKSD
nr:P1 family peptidase [Methylobacterium sp. 2A]